MRENDHKSRKKDREKEKEKLLPNTERFTVGPVHGEACPGELHLLSGVIGVEWGMQEEGHALDHESQAAMEEKPHFVPPWQWCWGIPGRLVDEGESWKIDWKYLLLTEEWKQKKKFVLFT